MSVNKSVYISQSNYIPWKGYFDSINQVDEFIIYDEMQYTRRDWRNRNKIKTNQGVQWLSVPVQTKGRFLQKINETKVSDTQWGKKHWQILQHNYSKAPFFELYASVFAPLYIHPPSEWLSEINYAFIKQICQVLGIQTHLSFSRNFTLATGKTERLVDLCQQVGATDYYSGMAAKNYLDETLFTQANIKVHYIKHTAYPAYTQLYPPFEHAVSILDLLFNTGEKARDFMTTFEQ
ncbi:WbqC family protein [uncultured Microscilla sp.]|uniref:WbqC family protein n=1 Tax=uncultured Microscilla sp. TaxID=432653 RepID=UPI00261E3F94|nr:WbqC family protein [uncultured Microscilla sp.]